MAAGTRPSAADTITALVKHAPGERGPELREVLVPLPAAGQVLLRVL
ncbi:MAG TPA: hypothetical protein VK060_00315 [Ruania sp.]|nr:hypothetical protein [Ruania sp.]